MPKQLPRVQDQHVYLIETRDHTPGAGWGPWEDLTPDQRYTADDIAEFEADLTADDCQGTQWRCRMLPQFGHDVRSLTPPRRVRFVRGPMASPSAVYLGV